MTERSGFVVVERYSLDGRGAVNEALRERLDRDSAHVRDVLAGYGGFEGILWPERPSTIRQTEGFASPDQLYDIRRYVNSLRSHRKCEVLHCHRAYTPMIRSLVPGFQEIGFDIGILAGEENCYSSIFHEVLFGKEPEMIAFRSLLNESKLFSSVADAAILLERRASLREAGADLESDEVGEFSIIRIAAPFLSRVPLTGEHLAI